MFLWLHYLFPIVQSCHHSSSLVCLSPNRCFTLHLRDMQHVAVFVSVFLEETKCNFVCLCVYTQLHTCELLKSLTYFYNVISLGHTFQLSVHSCQLFTSLVFRPPPGQRLLNACPPLRNVHFHLYVSHLLSQAHISKTPCPKDKVIGGRPNG